MPEDILNYFLFEKQINDQLNFDNPNDDDFEIIKMVCDNLEKTNKPKLDITNKNNAKKIALDSLNNLSFYNKELENIDLIENNMNDEYDYSTAIASRYNKKKNKILKNKSFVKGIIIPHTVTELAPIWLGHEYIHCLKDTNYLEFKSLYTEVLPLFYEILVSNEMLKEKHDNWKQARLYMFSHSKKMYELSKKKYKESNEEIHKYMMYSYGKYFLNYYYSVLLYSIYKDDKKDILKYINKILEKKKTTLQLLNRFELLNYKENKKFLLEHQKI